MLPCTRDRRRSVCAQPKPHVRVLQAFNWVSHKGDYYQHIVEMAPKFAAAGFTYVWLPPPTASVSPEGYMPTDYFNLKSCYGDEEGLRRAVKALKANGLKVAGDCVLNHRCALHQDEQGIWNRVRVALLHVYAYPLASLPPLLEAPATRIRNRERAASPPDGRCAQRLQARAGRRWWRAASLHPILPAACAV